jgi:hypothetical protein
MSELEYSLAKTSSQPLRTRSIGDRLPARGRTLAVATVITLVVAVVLAVFG